MSETSIALTDPAREMAELLTTLQGGRTDLQGDQFLAQHFGVPAWSQDFHRIVVTIMDRLAELKTLVSELELDSDYRAEMVGHVTEIASVFSNHGFVNAWQSYGGIRISPTNVQPIKGLSGLVRQKIAYRKLSAEDLQDLELDVAELIGWLKEHQLSQQDFIRQALIDGLEHLQFRLSKFKWLGWGYTLDSLREVIAAYMLLERQGPTPANNPDVEAFMAKVGSTIKAVYDKIHFVKEATETGDWLLRIYAATSIAQHALPYVRGLLPAS